MSERTELEWIAIESSPPRSKEELDRLRGALDRAGLVSSLVSEAQDSYELRVRPREVEVARQIVLQELETSAR